jgi:hypothetical protein
MNFLQFIRILRLLLVVGLFVAVGVLAGIGGIYHEISLESSFHTKCGVGWEAEYEKEHGSLTEARVKMVVCAVSVAAMGCLVVWLTKTIRPRHHSIRRNERKTYESEDMQESSQDRVLRYRLKAFWGIGLGVTGLFAGGAIFVFPPHLFSDPSNEQILGIVLFLCGYSSIVNGCSSWLKAKGWNEAIVFIAFAPLLTAFIPFVRLLLLASLVILPASMFFMSLTLVAVIFTLPDRSGLPRRRRKEHR